jgi:hypothetical protein
MNLRLFINADRTIVGTSATSGIEQRQDCLWLPKAWPAPTIGNGSYMEGGGVWNRAAHSICPCHRARCSCGSPQARVRSEHLLACRAGHSYHVRFCVIGAHVALIVVFRVESRESMTNDIGTSTSGVAPSDIELTGSASPDPAPAWPSCLALDDEGKNPLSRSRSQKSDSVKQTRRLGFSVHQPGARVA